MQTAGIASLLLAYHRLGAMNGQAHAPAVALEAGFAAPPAETKPWAYWYWLNDNVSADGITRDLEAMAAIGLGEVFLGHVFLSDEPRGGVRLLSEEWWSLLRHALREAARLDLRVSLFNGPGWSQSGGPWITSHQAMRHLAWSETRVTGPQNLAALLPRPQSHFEDAALVAFQAPQDDGAAVALRRPRVTAEPDTPEVARLFDGNFASVCAFPASLATGKPFIVEVTVEAPFTARSLTVHPAPEPFSVDCTLEADTGDGHFAIIRTFRIDRSRALPFLGPMIFGPVTVGFRAVAAKRFRLVFSGLQGNAGGLTEITLTGAPRVEHYVEKQLGKMHQTPQPGWDAYTWPTPPEPASTSLTVPAGQVVDLSDRMAPDGTLHWDVPPGEWILLRTGMAPTGVENHPTAPEGRGLEVDKMNRVALAAHFDAFIGETLKRLSPAERAVLHHVVADSYETGPQNWTDGFAADFATRYGYDPKPWLPVLTGRIVNSADESERFLWDLRRLVADRIARDYVGGLRELCHRHGLKLWLENYGHWGFPAEFLQYGGEADQIGGEFWAEGPLGELGATECRAAATASHIYGKRIVSAEAFTGGRLFQGHPGALKLRGDRAWCDGINHFVLSVCIHQPWEDRRPGLNAWFGTEFNRHNTWFARSGAWIDYLRRGHFLLQQGQPVADAAYFIGEDVPVMTGPMQPPLPPGHAADFINADVILHRLEVRDGRFVLPEGTSYRVLVLPPRDTMRPQLLRKIRDLVASGGTIVGTPPAHSPSRENHPACDQEVRALVSELWGAGVERQRRFGRGRVFRDADLPSVFAALELAPDFIAADMENIRWVHRTVGPDEIYFISNQGHHLVAFEASFRIRGKAPEFWHADSGRIVCVARFREDAAGTTIPLQLPPGGSLFVVFRQLAGPLPVVAAITAEDASAEVEVTRRADGSFAAEVNCGGVYRVKFADDREATFAAATVPAPWEIAGPWEVCFPPGLDVPRQIELDRLVSWTEHPDVAVRHFSGTATYRTRFRLDAAAVEPSMRQQLDLGQVGVLGEVFVNDRNLGTVWKQPFRVDLTGTVHAGENDLEVRVTNTWHNRLVGDRQFPAGFPDPAGLRREFKPWLSVTRGLRAQDPLEPSGLIGPVVLHTTRIASFS